MSPNLCFSFLVLHLSVFVSVTSEGFLLPPTSETELEKTPTNEKTVSLFSQGRI